MLASLLPLRIEPADVHPSRPQAAAHEVLNTAVAVATINNQDGTSIQGPRLPSPVPTQLPDHLADALRPQKTDGKVNNSAVAVTTIGNEEGVHEDYYIEYKGDGTTTDGWPAKTSWVSFADMYLSNTPVSPESLADVDIKV